jgi:uncharacterized protein YgbK (DUF1537 family)
MQDGSESLNGSKPYFTVEQVDEALAKAGLELRVKVVLRQNEQLVDRLLVQIVDDRRIEPVGQRYAAVDHKCGAGYVARNAV